MFLDPELQIAYRFFKSKTKDAFISIISLFSIIGIALGVGTLIIVMSVMSGYEIELITRLKGMNGDLAVMTNDPNTRDIIQQQLEEINGVDYAIQQINGQGLLSNGQDASGVSIKATSFTDIMKKKLLVQNILSGDLSNFSSDSIVIGIELATQLGVGIGDELKFISPKGSNTLMGFIPKFKTLQVVAIFDVGMYEHNLGTVFIDINTAFALFQKDNIDQIEVTIQNFDDAKQIIEAIRSNIAINHGLAIVNLAHSNQVLQEALKTERVVMYLILMLMIVIAAFNIISSLVILVKDKNKNIAILKTFGMSDISIAHIFIISGSIIGLIGTTVGSVLGTLLAYNIDSIKRTLEYLSGNTLFDPVIYYLTQLPANVDISNIVIIIFTSLGLSVLSTIYPALRAAKLEPAKTLRNE